MPCASHEKLATARQRLYRMSDGVAAPRVREAHTPRPRVAAVRGALAALDVPRKTPGVSQG